MKMPTRTSFPPPARASRALAAACPLALAFAAGLARAEPPPSESSWTDVPPADATKPKGPPADAKADAKPDPKPDPKADPRGSATKAGATRVSSPKGRAAKGEAYALGWTRLAGGDPCIGPRDLALSVERALGRPAFVSAARAERSIEGRVGPRFGGGWEATLHVVDAKGAVGGTRELTSDGPDCRELDEAITLSVALLIDPGGEAADADADADADAASGGAAPTAGASRAAAARPPKPRDEWFEVGLLAGYVSGDAIFPNQDALSDGLGAGIGARAGYAFRSGLWVGGSYTYYRGGDVGIFGYDREATVSSFGSTFQVHAVGAELGYRFALGPFEAKPYAGLGGAVFDFADGDTYIAKPGQAPLTSPPGLAGTSPLVALAVWPGVSLTLPLGDRFFAAADARWVLVAGAPAQNNVGAFGGVGVRF